MNVYFCVYVWMKGCVKCELVFVSRQTEDNGFMSPKQGQWHAGVFLQLSTQTLNIWTVSCSAHKQTLHTTCVCVCLSESICMRFHNRMHQRFVWEPDYINICTSWRRQIMCRSIWESDMSYIEMHKLKHKYIANLPRTVNSAISLSRSPHHVGSHAHVLPCIRFSGVGDHQFSSSYLSERKYEKS